MSMSEMSLGMSSSSMSSWLEVDFCSGHPDDLYLFPKRLASKLAAVQEAIRRLEPDQNRRPDVIRKHYYEGELVIVIEKASSTERAQHSSSETRSRGRLVQWLALDLAFVKLVDEGREVLVESDNILALPLIKVDEDKLDKVEEKMLDDIESDEEGDQEDQSNLLRIVLQTPALSLHCRLINSDELIELDTKFGIFEDACQMPNVQLWARLSSAEEGEVKGGPDYLVELRATLPLLDLMKLICERGQKCDEKEENDENKEQDQSECEDQVDLLVEEQVVDSEKDDYVRCWIEQTGSFDSSKNVSMAASLASNHVLASDLPTVSVQDDYFQVVISHVDSVHRFWMVPELHPSIDDFLSMQDEVQAWANNENISRTLPVEIYSLPPNTLVLAKDPNECDVPLVPVWNRAQLLYSHQATHEVHVLFVDSGKDLRVHVNNVKKLPKKFATIPRLALPSALVGFEGIQEDILIRINAMFSDMVGSQEVIEARIMRRGPVNMEELESYPFVLHVELFYKNCDDNKVTSINEKLIDSLRSKPRSLLTQEVMKNRKQEVQKRRKQELLEKPSSARVCKFYAQSGSCYLGDSCRFLHQQVADDTPLYELVQLQPQNVNVPAPCLPSEGTIMYIQVTKCLNPFEFTFIVPSGLVDVDKLSPHDHQLSKREETITSLMEDMQSYYSDKLRLKRYERHSSSEIISGTRDQILAVLNLDENKWYRVQVQKTHPRLELISIDYGMKIDNFSLDNLFVLDPRHSHLPMQALRGTLSGVRPRDCVKYCEEAVTYFRNIMFDPQRQKIARVDLSEAGVCYLQIFVQGPNDSFRIQDKLIEHGWATHL